MREYRDNLGLKIKPFARLTGVEPNLLRAWKTDQKQITIHFLEKYLRKFDQSIEKKQTFNNVK